MEPPYLNTKGSALVIPLLPPRARERGAEELPHTPQLRLFGGEALKGALRPCFRSPERWSRSDEPGARPLTGIGSVRAGPLEEHRARDLPARPASSWRSASTSITSRGWPPAPAAPRTWWRGSVRRGRRAAGGARRPRSRPGDGHRRRRRRGPGAADPSGAVGEQLVKPVDLDHVQGMATGAGGAEDLVPWIRPAWPASSWWSR